MLDTLVRPRLDPILEKIAMATSGANLGATPLTLIGFVISFAGCFAAAMGAYIPGLVLILTGRFLNGVATLTARTLGTGIDFGEYLRIVLEWVIYGSFIFLFTLSENGNPLTASLVLFALLISTTAATAYNYVMQKRSAGIISDTPSVFHPSRLVERTEILIFITLCCLFPHAFAAFAALFGILVLAATIGHIIRAHQNL